MMYPLVASVVLVSLWAIIKWLGRDIINKIASGVFAFTGIGAVHSVGQLLGCCYYTLSSSTDPHQLPGLVPWCRADGTYTKVQHHNDTRRTRYAFDPRKHAFAG